MPFFDGAAFGDPDAQAALGYLGGLASGFSQGAMPSRAPIPFGATLGAAAAMGREGAIEGAKNAQAFRKGQIETGAAAVGLDQATIVENMLRKALNMPPLNPGDTKGGVASPLFGYATAAPSSYSAPAAAAPAGTSGAQASEPSDDTTGMAGALVNKMLGFTPTEYQRAKLAADMMPPGPAKDEAETAAAKAAGLNPSLDTRSGGMQSVLVPGKFNDDGTPVYKTILKNPTIPEGYGAGPPDENGNPTIVPLQGGPEAVSDIAGRQAQANAHGRMTADAFTNWLDTGGLGLGTPEGGIKKPASGPAQPASSSVPNGYAQRVAQLESSGNPDAQNPQPGQTSAGLDGFNDATWLQQAKKYMPSEFVQGKTDAQLLALRNDPRVSAAMTNSYAQDNSAQLGKAGIKNVGPAELYLAHHFGPDGATTILKAPVNTPLSQLLPASVLKANPDLAGATVADVYSSARHAMTGVQQGNGQSQSPVKTPTIPASGNTGGVKSVIPDASEAAKIPSGEIYLKDRIPQWTKQEDEWADELPSNINGEQRALAIAEALKATTSGKWATEKADVSAGLKAVGINLPDGVLNDPAAVQTALKDNFQSVLEQIRAFSSRPAAVEVQLGSKNFANPNLQPEANLKIIGQVVGSMRWERALMNDWAAAKGVPNANGQTWQDPQDFQRAWAQHNPVQKYIDATVKEIGPLKGAPPPAGTHPIPSVQKQINAQSIAFTAKQRGISEDQVKADLRAKGYTVP